MEKQYKRRKRIFKYETGNTYIGQIKNNKREGYGTFYNNEGEVFEGNWKDDKAEDFGIYYYSNGEITKEILKKINGNGIYYYECGDKYEGNCIMIMEMFIMENGKIVKKMGKELLFIKAEINMMVIGKKEKRVVKEFIILKMEFFIINIKIWKKKD